MKSSRPEYCSQLRWLPRPESSQTDQNAEVQQNAPVQAKMPVRSDTPCASQRIAGAHASRQASPIASASASSPTGERPSSEVTATIGAAGGEGRARPLAACASFVCVWGCQRVAVGGAPLPPLPSPAAVSAEPTQRAGAWEKPEREARAKAP